MSVQARKINTIRQRLRLLRDREKSEPNRARRVVYRVLRWVGMIRHEFLADDVQIRAESLSFLMIFSLLPLIAGGFFLFSFFTQFGMVQDALQDVVSRFLLTIPEGHRDFVQQYVLRFKDAYLSSLQEKSGSIGIFALFILVWVGLQAFRNIDKTLNDIWSSDRARPLLEQARNFLVVAFVAPVALIAALSIPLILKRTPLGATLLADLPVLGWMMNAFVTPALLFATFVAMYRYVPVRHVRWRSALFGGGAATVALLVANYGVDIYFRFGTQSAYGKAAVVPVMGFWIYVVWIIVILGAEVSYLVQNGRNLLAIPVWDPSLREGEGMLAILVELWRAHKDGTNPVNFERLHSVAALDADRLHGLLDYLQRSGFVLECAVSDAPDEGSYALAKDMSEATVSELLGAFFHSARGETTVGPFWKQAVEEWTAQFKDLHIAELAQGTSKKKSKRS